MLRSPDPSTRPIRRPTAVTVHNIHEVLRNEALYLLARVQLIVPSKAVWRVGESRAIASRSIAMVDEASHVVWSCAVEVARRVVVDVGHLCQVSLRTQIKSHGTILTRPCTS